MKIELENIMIAHSPLTDNIYAGSISKPGVWKNKVDVTDKVYAAVIEANLNQVHSMSFGDRTFELTVEEVFISAIDVTIDNLKAIGFTEQSYEGLTWLQLKKPHPLVTLFTGDKKGYLEVILEIANAEIKRMRYLHEVKKAIKFFTS